MEYYHNKIFMIEYTLIKHIILDLFDVNLYKINNYTGSVVDNTIIDNAIVALNNQESAIELAQLAASFDGVSRIEIFDKSNNLILEVGPAT